MTSQYGKIGHLLARLFAHSLVCSLRCSLAHTLARSLADSYSHVCSLVHPLVRSLARGKVVTCSDIHSTSRRCSMFDIRVSDSYRCHVSSLHGSIKVVVRKRTDGCSVGDHEATWRTRASNEEESHEK